MVKHSRDKQTQKVGGMLRGGIRPVNIVLLILLLFGLDSFELREQSRRAKWWLENGTTTTAPSSSKSSLSSSLSHNNSLNWAIVLAVNDKFFHFFQNWMTQYDKLQLDHPIHVFASSRACIPWLELIQQQRPNFYFHHLEGEDYTFDITTTSAAIGTTEHDKAMLKQKLYIVSRRAAYIQRVWNITSSQEEEEEETTSSSSGGGGRRRRRRSVDAILFTDADAVFRRNPFPSIESVFQQPLTTSTTSSRLALQVDPSKGGTSKFNTGFVAMQKTKLNYQFLQEWRQEIENPPSSSQDGFNYLYERHNNNKAKTDDTLQHDDSTWMGSVVPLPLDTFPHGRLFFKGCHLVNKTTDRCLPHDQQDVELARKAQENAVVVHTNGPFSVNMGKVDSLNKYGLWEISNLYKVEGAPIVVPRRKTRTSLCLGWLHDKITTLVGILLP